MQKGTFITLYGINNIGKSTHAKLLCKKLEEQGFKTHYLKYPIYEIEPSGPFINKTLRNPEGQAISEDELQFWFVLNRYQFQPQLKKLLEEGYVVVAEDYIGTGIAWGMAKGLEEEWLTGLNTHLVKEDLSILIEGNRDLRARETTHVHEQNDALVEKCKETHNYLGEKYDWKKIHLQDEISDTAGLIFGVVDEFLKKRYS
jgi:dTMP kinase